MGYSPRGRKVSMHAMIRLGFSGGSVVKESTCDVGHLGSIPELGRSPGGGHGNPLQYSCMEIPKDRGASWAAVHRVAKSQIRVSEQLSTT